ncbi:acylphosphatase [Rathayibacter sp. YIM 133350]|uniref:acylphosphatase n=1 Tax=Rathayibacter sp. YIM 133350 TaxID=3131992 RepID=UPI00307D935E
MERRNVVVSGVVQGVGFRWSARAQALRLGVSGWVRNTPDGRVEAEVEGDADAVAAMVEWLRAGPAGASVSGVEVREREPLAEIGFEITR